MVCRGILQYFYGWPEKDVKAALDLQFNALAEYSWNAKGRSIKDFGESWATRHGYRHPVQFGKWMELMSATVRMDKLRKGTSPDSSRECYNSSRR